MPKITVPKWFSAQGENKITLAWFLCLIAYVSFRFANINAPELTNAFVTITGIFVGNLGIKKTRESAERSALIEEKLDRTEIKADDALGRSDVFIDQALSRVLDVQEHEIVANRAALQLMKDAIKVKEETNIPVLPETYDAVTQLEHQIELLSEDIEKRRAEAKANIQSTRSIAQRAESKADDLAKFAKKAHPNLNQENRQQAEDDRRDKVSRDESDRREGVAREETDTRSRVAREENDIREKFMHGEDDNNV